MTTNPKTSTILWILAIWAVTAVHAAHHAAPSPSVDCMSLVPNMVDCLSFVTNDSTVTKPEGKCCSGLKSVLKTNPECLCEAFKNSAQLGVTLNVTKALTLPSACHVSAPSFTNCGSLSPVALSPGSIAAAPTTPGADELAPSPAPAPAPGSSGSSVLAISLSSFILTAASLSLF